MGPMRYIIIGAGAVGGTIGGRLFASGHEVVLVARGRHLDALRAHGLRLETPGLPTPVNEVLQRLANQAARQRQAPGSTTPGEVMALLAA